MTVCDFLTLATCYAELNGRDRPEADVRVLIPGIGKQMSKHSDTSEVQISLNADEALVLFELLSRFEESDELTIVDQAEERALWNLLALLQKQPVSPFQQDYLEQLQRARDRVRDNLA